MRRAARARGLDETALEYSAAEEDRLVAHLATSEMRGQPFIRLTQRVLAKPHHVYVYSFI